MAGQGVAIRTGSDSTMPRRLQARMCKTCLDEQFWNYQGMNLLLGPWGMISLIMTPVYLVTNTVSYTSARRKLQSAVE